MKFKDFINSRRLSWVITGAGMILTLIVFFFLPAQIPMHFTASGIADDYSGRIQIFLFPILQLLIMLLTGGKKIKYCLTHSKMFLSDIQYNWIVSGLCLFIILGETLVLSVVF